MKNKIIIIYFIFSFNIIFGQENFNNSVQLSPANFTNFPLSIGYQRALNNYFNIEAILLFSMYDQVFIYYDYSDPQITEIAPGYYTYTQSEPIKSEFIDQALELNFGLGLVYRPFGHRLKGFYIELLQGIDINTLTKSKNTILYLPTELQIGYQWLFTQGVTISLGLGLARINKISNDILIVEGKEYGERKYENDFFNLYLFHIRLGVGYSW